MRMPNEHMEHIRTTMSGRDVYIHRGMVDVIEMEFIERHVKHVIERDGSIHQHTVKMPTIHKPHKTKWNSLGPTQSFMWIVVSWEKFYEDGAFKYVPFVSSPNPND